MTSAPFSPTVTLHDGAVVPQLGLGVYKVADAEATTIVRDAIESGYRHIDTAKLYANEKGTGDGMRASGVAREELFVTTKLWDDEHGYEQTLAAFEASRARLGLDYVDLYLIHWPAPRQNRYVESWRAMQKLQADGVVRSIGVSNFHIHHLQRLIDETGVVPALNQVELHPWLPQREVRAFGEVHGIVTEAWSPLARGRVIGDPVLDGLAAKHGVTPAQIVIRWHVQQGIVVIPKSVSIARIRENADVFGFSLDESDMAVIAAMESGERTGMDPDDHG